jgi:hypothetical protein
MRTTLSLDDDVAQLLNKEVRRSGGSFKEVVNRFLRMGLVASKRPTRKPFVVKPWDLMPPAGLSFDNVEDLLDTLEGPERR